MDSENFMLINLEDSSEDSDNSLIFSSSSSTNSSSSNEIEIASSIKRKKIENYLDVIESYTELQFKQHFRLEKFSANGLINDYTDYYSTLQQNIRGREIIGPVAEIYIFLWYMANTNSYREISDRFDITKSSVHRVLHRVVKWIIAISPKYIKWPSPSDMYVNEMKFRTKTCFPNVVGAIDGSHIEISAPREQKLAYYNRKKYYSILIQAIVDANKKFMDVYCGEPGSMHDARLFKRSTFYRKISENPNLIPRDKILLGDSAYPQMSYLVTPYKEFGNLTSKQRKFNTLHSSTRIVVENAFGLLKRRFRRLTFFESPDLGFVANCVLAACVLHNICIMTNDFEEWLDDDSVSNINSDSNADEYMNHDGDINLPQNTQRREEIFDLLDGMNLLN